MAVRKHSRMIELLGYLILDAKSAYYAGTPAISDYQYDQLEDMLRRLDPTNPILDVVGPGSGE